MKPNENAKNNDWNTPVDLSHVTPQDYASDIKSGNGSAAASLRSGPPHYTMPGHHHDTSVQTGQEEHNHMRNATTSIIGRTAKH